MRVLKAALAEVKGTIGLICLLIISAVALSFILTGDKLQVVYLLTGFAGLFTSRVSQDLLKIYERPYKFNKTATYISPFLLLGGMGIIAMNVMTDIPVGVMLFTSMLAGLMFGWFGIIYSAYLHTLQDNKDLTVLDVMKDAHETLQTRGSHSDFCAIHPTGLKPKTDRHCSCGLEHSIRQLRAAIRIVTKT